MLAYKFLRRGAVGPFSGFRWPRPRRGGPGAWVGVDGALELCTSGVHACRVSHLPYWLNDELWAVELEGELREEPRCLLAPRGRLVGQVDAWTRAVARELNEACARRTRDLVVAALQRAGFAKEAEALATAGKPDAIDQAALAAAEAASRAGAADAAAAAGFASDCAWCLTEGGARIGSYSAAYAAARVAKDAGAFARERDWQARWLAERLGL